MYRPFLAFGLLCLLCACGDSESPEKPSSLVIRNPAIDLSKYTVGTAEDFRTPEYIFLAKGRDAVTLPGPSTDAQGGALFRLEGELIEKLTVNNPDLRVKVNPHLTYDVSIGDYEDEVEIAQVELVLKGATIESTFIFAASATSTGVAHDVQITPFVDGAAGTPTTPESIEVRTVSGTP